MYEAFESCGRIVGGDIYHAGHYALRRFADERVETLNASCRHADAVAAPYVSQGDFPAESRRGSYDDCCRHTFYS